MPSSPSEPTPAHQRCIADAIARFQNRRPLRAGSLVITVFGDAIAPRGGAISLATLSDILAPFELSDSLVRTTLSRLTSDGWFERRKVGRRSVYALSRSGSQRVEEATRRIYASESPGWAGEWTVVVLPDDGTPAREQLKRDLSWIGFGTLGGSVMLHAAADEEALQSVLSEHAALDALVIRGRAETSTPTTLRRVTAKGWNFDQLRHGYLDFIRCFEPTCDAVRASAPSPRDALTLRLAAVHEYRRVMLHDPLLPQELLSSDWVGKHAHRLCAAIYRSVLEPSEYFLDQLACGDEGLRRTSDARVWGRFESPGDGAFAVPPHSQASA